MKLTKGTLPLERKEAEIRVRKAVMYCRIQKHDIREAVRIFTDEMMRSGHLVELWQIEAIAAEYRFTKDQAENMFKQFEANHLCFRENNPVPAIEIIRTRERKSLQIARL